MTLFSLIRKLKPWITHNEFQWPRRNPIKEKNLCLVIFNTNPLFNEFDGAGFNVDAEEDFDISKINLIINVEPFDYLAPKSFATLKNFSASQFTGWSQSSMVRPYEQQIIWAIIYSVYKL